VVRQRFAKPLYAGSNPVLASGLQWPTGHERPISEGTSSALRGVHPDASTSCPSSCRVRRTPLRFEGRVEPGPMRHSALGPPFTLEETRRGLRVSPTSHRARAGLHVTAAGSTPTRPLGGMADAADLKSAARKGVPVQPRQGLLADVVATVGDPFAHRLKSTARLPCTFAE
jgi:hypothetical protein